MKDVIIGIDAGTSVIKSVVFTLGGEQIAECAIPNSYESLANGGVEQDMALTWAITVKTLAGLHDKVDDLAKRVAAIAVTGQGDGTWLADSHGEAVTPGWLWLDARAGDLVDEFRASDKDALRFRHTGTGLNACQQGSQMMWMSAHAPELLSRSAVALHCKDWLYFNLTGELATDPSEGTFTFGDFRTRQYSDEVIELLGLEKHRHLLPPIIDGIEHNHLLSAAAAKASGLLSGTPVILGYVDVICTAMGAGLYSPRSRVGCSIVGSTGMHMQLVKQSSDIALNEDRTGYIMTMPVPGCYAQLQSNMASTLNIDWLLDLAAELLGQFGTQITRKELVTKVDDWIAQAKPDALFYQPYISEAGERGPIINNAARAGFVGLSQQHRFPDLVLAVVEGLAMAGRDCYSAMGSIPDEIRLTGGAARSRSLRSIFASALGAPVRVSSRAEAGAAGAAMMAAVSIGHYKTMDDCVAEWVEPLLGECELADPAATYRYDILFAAYEQARQSLLPVWQTQSKLRRRDA